MKNNLIYAETIHVLKIYRGGLGEGGGLTTVVGYIGKFKISVSTNYFYCQDSMSKVRIFQPIYSRIFQKDSSLFFHTQIFYFYF